MEQSVHKTPLCGCRRCAPKQMDVHLRVYRHRRKERCGRAYLLTQPVQGRSNRTGCSKNKRNETRPRCIHRYSRRFVACKRSSSHRCQDSRSRGYIRNRNDSRTARSTDCRARNRVEQFHCFTHACTDEPAARGKILSSVHPVAR